MDASRGTFRAVFVVRQLWLLFFLVVFLLVATIQVRVVLLDEYIQNLKDVESGLGGKTFGKNATAGVTLVQRRS